MSNTFYIHRGDTIPPLDITLSNTGSTVVPTTNMASIIYKVPNLLIPGFYISRAPIIIDANAGKVRIIFTGPEITGMKAGIYHSYFVITYIDGSVRTYPNDDPDFIKLFVT